VWRAALRKNYGLETEAFHGELLPGAPDGSVDLMHAAQTALLPPLAGIAASAVAGPASDAAISGGVPVAVARKAAQSVAFLVPTACLLAAATAGDDLGPAAGPPGPFLMSERPDGATVWTPDGLIRPPDCP
jgi:hypothetical protein